MKRKGKQKMRRFSALFLSLMLICALSMTAFATSDGNVSTDTNGAQSGQTTEHSYKAYQIFKGDLHEGKLSNIGWGVSAQKSAIQSAIAGALLENGEEPTLENILAALANVENNSAAANKLAEAIATHKDDLEAGISVGNGTKVDSGYYILIDETVTIEDGDSRGFALLQCLDGVIKFTEKRGTVTSDKKVKDKNDSVYDPTEDTLGTSADYDIGDEVPFVLTGTVADKFDMFETYEFVFHDKMSPGLSFNKDSVSVKIGETQIDSGYSVVTEGLEDGDTFHVIFADLKTIEGVDVGPGSKITIEYTATLNDNAVIGSEGNENTMYLEYSSDPYTGETGKTPGNTTIVFTYKVEVNKIKENKEALAGAGFTLYKYDQNYTDANGNLKDDGVDGNNVLDGTTYNKLVASYNPAAADGVTSFSFDRIDDGKYLLVETQTPDGYNSIEPVAFEVTAEHGLDASGQKFIKLDGKTITGTVELEFSSGEGSDGSGTLATNVVNKSGSLLPSTGGIGTTMFYIIGGVLMVGACMMLFVRKIMTNEKR